MDAPHGCVFAWRLPASLLQRFRLAILWPYIGESNRLQKVANCLLCVGTGCLCCRGALLFRFPGCIGRYFRDNRNACHTETQNGSLCRVHTAAYDSCDSSLGCWRHLRAVLSFADSECCASRRVVCWDHLWAASTRQLWRKEGDAKELCRDRRE